MRLMQTHWFRKPSTLQTIDAARDWANLDGQTYLTLKRIHYRLTHV